MRRFHSMVLAMPRETVFWQLVKKTPHTVEGESARATLRNL